MGKRNKVPSAAELRKYVEDDIAVASDDDEEIDEDEAFDSSDERKFGHFFNAKSGKDNRKTLDESDQESNSSSEEDSDDGSDDGIASEEDDSDEGDGGEYMLSLLDKLSPAYASTTKAKNKENEKDLELDKNIPESEFSSSVVQSSNLTMNQLMSGITDTKGFSKIQSSMKEMIHPEHALHNDPSIDSSHKPLTTTLAPVSRIVSERTKRKVHYEDQKENIKNWEKAVQENRKAESLDFRPKIQDTKIHKEDMISKFEPETDFEKEIHAVLEAVGASDESKILKGEEEDWNRKVGIEDDLGEANLTLEQYEARQGQLAKMRALMFYEEQKRHHINKIKSKKYRKIRKNQRERMKDAEMKDILETGDSELLNELKEKEEMERMQERMSLAHKNTSKWAKRQLRRGKALDIGTRRALSAQVQKGQDLKKKMDSIRDGNESEDSDHEGEDEDQIMIDKAKSILKQTEDDIEKSGNEQEKQKGLFKMSFMQKGMKIQRERAKAEAKKLLEELEENNDGSEDEYDYGLDRANNDWKHDVVDQDKKKLNEKKQEKMASVDEISKVLPTGKLVVSSLEFGKSNSISVNGSIAVDLENDNKNESTKQNKEMPTRGVFSEYTTSATLTKAEIDEDDKKISENKRSASIRDEAKREASSNPWLSEATKKKSKRAKSEAQDALLSMQDDPSDGNINHSEKTKQKPNEDVERGTMQMSQEELVRKAFAAPTDVEVEEEFQKEKDEIHEIENPNKADKDTTVKGWGSWVGEGTVPPKRKKNLPKHLQAPKSKKANTKPKRKDSNLKHVIINEKRVKKNAQFQLGSVPYPYQSREQYEKAMAGSIGREWNVASTVKNMTRSEIVTRIGKVIKPISKRAKIPARGPAKF